MPNTVCLFGPAFSLTGDSYFAGKDVTFHVIIDDQSASNGVLTSEWYLDNILLLGQNSLDFIGNIDCGSHTIGVRILSGDGWSGVKSLKFDTCKVPLSIVLYGTDFLNEGESTSYYVLQLYSDGSNDNLTDLYIFSSTAGGSFENNKFTAGIDDNSYASTEVTITALKNGVAELTKQVRINNTSVPVVVSLLISGPNVVDEGATAEYAIIATYSNDTQQDLSAEYVFNSSEGYFTGKTFYAPSNSVSGDTRNVTLSASKNGRQPLYKNISINDKTLKAGILVVDLYNNSSLNAIGLIDNTEVAGNHIAVYTGLNILPVGAVPAQALILASDLNFAAITNWRFEFNLAKMVAENPGITDFVLYVKGRAVQAGTLSGSFSLKSNNSQMVLTGSPGSYMPSVTGGINTTPLQNFSSPVIGGAKGSYVENDLGNIIRFVYNAPTDTLTYTLPDEPIVISHDFDFMAVRYNWLQDSGSDLDILVGFENNGTPFDAQYVGYGQPTLTIPGSVVPQSDAYLWWAADNTSATGYECVLIGMQKFTAAFPSSPNIVEAGLYAVWYGTPISGDFSVELVTYKGGTMVINGTNFINQGGVQISSDTVQVSTKINSSSHKPATSYKVGVVRYDKTTKTASIIIN